MREGVTDLLHILGEKLGSEWRESSSLVKIDYKIASQICKMMIGDDGPS